MQHEFAKSPYNKRRPSPPPPPPKSEMCRNDEIRKKFIDFVKSANTLIRAKWVQIRIMNVRTARTLNHEVPAKGAQSILMYHRWYASSFRWLLFSFLGLVTLPTLDFIESTFDACFRSARFGNVPFFAVLRTDGNRKSIVGDTYIERRRRRRRLFKS